MTKFIQITLSLSVIFIILGSIPCEAVSYERDKDKDLKEWIDKLAHYESSGRENIKILDSNNRYSIGCLQFQERTWEEQTKKHGIQGNIYDCQKQKEVALAMLKENPKNWRHWYTSVKRGLGIPPNS